MRQSFVNGMLLLHLQGGAVSQWYHIGCGNMRDIDGLFTCTRLALGSDHHEAGIVLEYAGDGPQNLYKAVSSISAFAGQDWDVAFHCLSTSPMPCLPFLVGRVLVDPTPLLMARLPLHPPEKKKQNVLQEAVDPPLE